MRLRGLGYAVMAIAKDGREAIEKATELHPDLILMDIKLGDGMDGIEAAEQIRAVLDIPVVYVSAYVDQKLLERARETHPAGFINKPFTTKDLLTTIDLALFQRGERRAEPRAIGIVPNAAAEEPGKEAIVTSDIEGRVNFVSDSAKQLLGWRRKQIVGRPLGELIAEIYRIDTDTAAKIVERTLHLGGEERLTRPDDSGAAGDNGKIDVLTPLRDAQGQSFGVALKLT